MNVRLHVPERPPMVAMVEKAPRKVSSAALLSFRIRRVGGLLSRCLISAPGFYEGVPAKQEHLDHSAAGECLHHGAARWLDLRSRFAYLHPGDPVDLLPQRVGGAGKQLSVKLLHLSSSCRRPG